jgi:hypothetical protein
MFSNPISDLVEAEHSGEYGQENAQAYSDVDDVVHLAASNSRLNSSIATIRAANDSIIPAATKRTPWMSA